MLSFPGENILSCMYIYLALLPSQNRAWTDSCFLGGNESLNFYSSPKQKTIIIIKVEEVLNPETRTGDGCLVGVKRGIGEWGELLRSC